MPETILVLNAGSSSIKFQLFAVGADDKLIRRMKGQVDGIGTRARQGSPGLDSNAMMLPMRDMDLGFRPQNPAYRSGSFPPTRSA